MEFRRDLARRGLRRKMRKGPEQLLFCTSIGLPRTGPGGRISERATEPAETDLYFKFPTTAGVF